jgi:hypothetical protein
MPNNEGKYIVCMEMLVELLKIMAWELNATTDREIAVQTAARKSITIFIDHLTEAEK